MISELRDKIEALEKLRDAGFATSENLEQLKRTRTELDKSKAKLKRLRNDAERSKKFRKRKSELVKNLAAESEANAIKLKGLTNEGPGRPPLEDSYPLLHEAVVRIASFLAGADSRRQTDILEACHTLDDLRAALAKEGINLSRSALYLRMTPRRVNSSEGKRHVRTVPVKIRRAKNNLRERHSDANFTFSTKGYIKEIATCFGSKNTFVLSVDDKAKVPIGVTAAKYQTPLVMHMTYEIRLPDHDYVKGPKHKLIPSVYAACEIKSASAKTPEEISYSGPTYIAIRSLKHDSSTAYTHGYDFNKVMELEEFQSIVKTSTGDIKPIGIMSVDGGPDENPRFPKAIDVYTQHFKKFNFDALLVMTHAPGMSAYNYVERRMAPLSKELEGLVLPHDTFGTHLDSQRRTIDVELEKKNFGKPGEVLQDVWSELHLDGHPIVAKYETPGKHVESLDPCEIWNSIHTRTSQYFLQIIKCDNFLCCGKMRTKWMEIFPKRFLPPPAVIRRDEGGPSVPEPSEVKATDQFAGLWQRMAMTRVRAVDGPYNEFCPSVQKEISNSNRICKHCHTYFTSAAAVTRHRRGCTSLVGLPIPKPMAMIVEDDKEIGEEIGEKDVDDAR